VRRSSVTRALRALPAALALAASIGLVSQACAQAFPSRPIRLVVPLAPGGTNDTLARNISDRLGERLGQQIVVDNRPGGNSTIGSAIVARANPDGHTLLIMGAGHAINPSVHRNLPYDTEREFAPIGQVAVGPYLLVIHPSIPAKTVKEYVAWVKARPKQVSFASAGTGNPVHLAGELFNIATGMDMQHIPYKGGGALLPDLVSGRVSMTFSSIATVQSNVNAGRLRPIAVTTQRRSVYLPDVPTFIESGYPSFEINAWYGMLTTGKTPRAVVERLSADLQQVLNDPQTRTAFNRHGLDPQPTSADQFKAMVSTEIARWAKVVRDAGIKPE
jgi:tripartite-type tricarboxylate transporter receptor subunit TctC